MPVKMVLRILLLEDNEHDATLISYALQKQDLLFITERVETRKEFIESLHRFQPDVILSDHGLPSFNSHEALKIRQEHPVTIPFIMVSAVDSMQQAFDYIDEGADDYVLKSNLTGLSEVIKKAIQKHKR